jgi:hypothetical protein
MDYRPSSRLSHLASKYARAGDLPAGEGFQSAFSRFLKANRESLLDIAVAVTSVQIAVGDGPQDVDPLLLRAIRDTNPSLSEAHLFALQGEALQGAVNTAKGKYFEYLVVDKLNNGVQVGPLLLEEGQTAVLADSMTQPGWDLRIVDQHGAIVEYLQLKATDSVAYVQSALERSPDMQILATDEVVDSGRDGHLRGLSARSGLAVHRCIQNGVGKARPTNRCHTVDWSYRLCLGWRLPVHPCSIRRRVGL